MAERRRTRAAATAERPAAARPPAGDPPRRASRRRRPAEDELEPAEDELEPAEDEEPELAEDELEPADEEPELAEDELEEAEPDAAEDEFGLAEEEDDDEDAATGRPSANGRRRARDRGDPPLTARQAVRAALQQIAELTTKQPEDITGLQRTDEGWAIRFEVVQDRRIPSSADILATYEATIDEAGELTSYRRIRSYARGRGDSSEGH